MKRPGSGERRRPFAQLTPGRGALRPLEVARCTWVSGLCCPERGSRLHHLAAAARCGRRGAWSGARRYSRARRLSLPASPSDRPRRQCRGVRRSGAHPIAARRSRCAVPVRPSLAFGRSRGPADILSAAERHRVHRAAGLAALRADAAAQLDGDRFAVLRGSGRPKRARRRKLKGPAGPFECLVAQAFFSDAAASCRDSGAGPARLPRPRVPRSDRRRSAGRARCGRRAAWSGARR